MNDAASAGAVRLRNIAVSFGIGTSRFDAVTDVDLDVGAHEFVAIVGPTGCGKSTLLNVTAGLQTPVAGSVEVFGRPLQGLNGQAGYLFQQESLMPWKTVIENVAIGLEVAGIATAEARRTAAGWLERVGLAGFGDRYPRMLSGGQRKRVGLAQVLIRDPKLLLMDEPFGPLDAQTRLVMGDLLLKLWSGDRKAVMFITHDLDEAIGLADRVLIMSAGPKARMIGNFTVPLPRPRDIAEIRHDGDFIRLHREIWNALRDEVMKAYRSDEGSAP